MHATGRLSILKALSLAALAVLGGAMLPGAAEAQARGSVQATARVVETRQSVQALQAARALLQGQRPVATVAQITVDRPAGTPRTLVVTINYSRS